MSLYCVSHRNNTTRTLRKYLTRFALEHRYRSSSFWVLVVVRTIEIRDEEEDLHLGYVSMLLVELYIIPNDKSNATYSDEEEEGLDLGLMFVNVTTSHSRLVRVGRTSSLAYSSNHVHCDGCQITCREWSLPNFLHVFKTQNCPTFLNKEDWCFALAQTALIPETALTSYESIVDTLVNRRCVFDYCVETESRGERLKKKKGDLSHGELASSTSHHIAHDSGKYISIMHRTSSDRKERHTFRFLTLPHRGCGESTGLLVHTCSTSFV